MEAETKTGMLGGWGRVPCGERGVLALLVGEGIRPSSVLGGTIQGAETTKSPAV